MRERAIRDLSAWTRRSAPGVSLKPPRPPLVKGVRRQAVITMSLGDLERMAVRLSGMSVSEVERWDWSCVSRVCAIGCEGGRVEKRGWGLPFDIMEFGQGFLVEGNGLV